MCYYYVCVYPRVYPIHVHTAAAYETHTHNPFTTCIICCSCLSYTRNRNKTTKSYLSSTTMVVTIIRGGDDEKCTAVSPPPPPETPSSCRFTEKQTEILEEKKKEILMVDIRYDARIKILYRRRGHTNRWKS